jgi:hypothetical protein
LPGLSFGQIQYCFEDLETDDALAVVVARSCSSTISSRILRQSESFPDSASLIRRSNEAIAVMRMPDTARWADIITVQVHDARSGQFQSLRLRRRFRGMEGRADQRHPPPLSRVLDTAWSVSLFLQYMDRALSFELRCDVDRGPAEEPAS